MEHTTNKFGAIIPKYITKSYIKFASEIHQSELFIMLIFIGGDYITDNKKEVRETIIEFYSDPGNETAEKMVALIETGQVDNHLDLETYELFYGQMCYARTIDNVLTYFKEILSEVIVKTPNVLKSKETERLDFILNYDTIEELRIALSEKKIEALFYAGIDKIETYFKERLGVELFKSEETKLEFNQAIKNRNLIVHNRGVISKEYLKEFPKCSLVEGDIIKFGYEDISRVNLILLNFSAYLDNELSEKFKLELKENN